MEFTQVLKVLKRSLWFIVLFVLVATIGIGYYSYTYLQPVYEASAKLILVPPDEQSDGRPVDYNTLMANGVLMDTYRDIAKTKRLMDKVVERYPELNVTSDLLLSRVTVNPSNNQIFTIVVQDNSYPHAAQIANSVAEVMKTEIPSIVKMDNIDILDPAPNLKNASPVYPNPVINIAAAIIVSFLLSVAVVIMKDYLNDKVRTHEDIEALLGVTAVAVVPKMKRSELYPMIPSVSSKAGDRPYVTVNQ